MNLETMWAAKSTFNKTNPTESEFRRQLSLTSLIDLAINNSGCIPMNYRVSGNSARWYAIGGYRSLQSCPKWVQNRCLSGDYEYDISSFNQRVLQHHAIENGLPYEALEYLINNKQEILHGEAETIQIDPKTYKKILLAVNNFAEIQEPEHARGYIKKLLREKSDQPVGERIKIALASLIWNESQSSIDVFEEKYSALHNSKFLRGYCKETRAIALHMADTIPCIDPRCLARSVSYYISTIEVKANLAMYCAMPSSGVSIFDAITTEVRGEIEHAEEQIRLSAGMHLPLKEASILAS